MRYREYKKVDLPWLDELPSHWDIKNVNSLFNIRRGVVIPKTELVENGKYPVYSSQTKNHGILGYLNNYDIEGYSITWTTDGANAGTVFFREGKYNCTNICGILESREKISRYQYIYYAYVLKETCIHHKRKDTNGYKIMSNEMKRIELPSASKEEQEQIARFLDWKINEIDRMISIREKQIKNLEKTRRILIIDTMLNNDYKSVMLSRCVSENKRKNTNSNQNLLSLSYGKIIRKDINSTFGLLPEKFDKYQLVDKSNIILRLTDLQNDHKSLRVGLVKEKGIITSAYIGLICNDMVIPEYLYYYLNAMDLRKDFYSMGAGVRQNLNYNELKKINIKLPDKDTQKYIIDYLNENEIRIKKIIKSKEKQINNLQQLKKSLISDVVTGKIDVRKISIHEYEKVSDIEDDTILEENFNEEV